MQRYITVILIIFISFIHAQSYVDIVNLKNGDVIKGQIIENVLNDHIRIELQGGSILTYQYSQIESIEVEKKSTRTFGSNNQVVQPIMNTTPVRDCYNDGYSSGQSVSAGGAMVGGLVGGFVLGLIGWGLSYAIVASGSPQPPNHETASLNDNCVGDYRRGYKEGALKTKKSSVNIGGALGTLIIVSITLSTSGY